MDNPFADLIPKKAAANPFADLIPKAAPLHDMQRNPAAQPTVPNDPIVALGDRARAPAASPAPAPAPIRLQRGAGRPSGSQAPSWDGAKKIGSAAVEGFTGALAPSDEERERGQKAYGRLGEAVATGLTETAKLPAAAANAGTSALSQLLAQLGLGKQGATEEEQRGELNEQLGIGLMGAGVEMPMRAGEAPRASEAPKPRVEPPPLGTSPAAPAPNPFENLIPRNAEGRPVVSPGVLPPEAATKPDPRAAEAGQAAVAKAVEPPVGGQPTGSDIDKLRAAFKEAQRENGGMPHANISVLIEKSGLSTEAVHNALREGAARGEVTLAPSDSVEHSAQEKGTALNIPGHEPFYTAGFKDAPAKETSTGPMQGPLHPLIQQNIAKVGLQPAMQGYADDLLKRFGIKLPVTVRLINMPEHKRGSYVPSFGRATPQAADTFKRQFSTFNQRGEPSKLNLFPVSHEIHINAKHSPAHAFGTLLHELGHLIHYTKFQEADDTTRKSIVDAYRRDAKLTREMPESEWLDKAIDPISKAGVAATPGVDMPALREYQTKFNEWFANQVRVFLSTNKEAVTTADKFFKGVADAWKFMYERLTGRKAVAAEVEKFLMKEGGYKAAIEPRAPKAGARYASAGAAATPTVDLLKQNTADYEAKMPKAPGAVQLVKDAGNALKAILHPQSLNDSARRAEGSIRKNIGRGVQDSERAKVAMEPYRKWLQQMSTEQQLGVLKWLQKPEEAAQRHVKSGSGTFDPPDELKPFLEAFRSLMLDRKAKLEARSKTGDMGFKDDYVSQMWRDPDAARDVLHSLGPKEGSNAFTKRSVIEDYEAGIKAGLIPLTTDPVEIAMRYVENVDRFIAINDVLEEGAANKDIVWRAPEHAPNGWVKLDGRARSFRGGAFQDAYAPPGYADVYNAFVSKPPQGRWGDILSGAQKISNSVSAFKLAVSGYHALNIAGEANVAGLANAIDKLAGGDVLGAARGVAGSPAKFMTSVARGRQMLNTYLTGMGSKDMQKVVQLAVDANFRVAGKGRVADEYRFSSMGSLWDSWRKGLLKGELAAMGKDIKERPLVGSAKAIVSTAARALETLSDPLFKHYIPMVKNGAYFDMVKTWLDAHPTATNEEQVAFARKAADTIDNRFGEMNQDNIFWQRWQKQLAQTLVVSYSYELGTARSVVGAAKDAVGLARGKGWTPNLSYAIALPAMVGMMGATYQYMKTGKPPDGPRDAMYPQTGGQDPMSGQPARAVLPSYMSQFVNAYYGGLTHELAGKKNGVFDLLSAAFTGQDWRGDPITAVDDSTTDAIKKWLGYAASTWEPILATQTKKGGTGISGGERFIGIREAPMFANDPQAYKRMMDSKRLQADAEKAWHDHNAELEAKGQHPNFMVKRKFIQDYLARHKPKYGGTQ